jgi:acyl-CoA dehydrogenase
MIDFSIAPLTQEVVDMIHTFNVDVVRDMSRYYDEYEHEHDEMTDDEIALLRENLGAIQAKAASGEKPSEKPFLMRVIMAEERAWGANIFGGGATNQGLGNSAINAVGTPEQKARFGGLYCAMAITEPSCGSDTAAVQATAKLDTETNEWILNGEKIFVTAGKRCEAVVVWASLDRSRGRPAIKSFVVEKTRPGISMTKLEDKLGIRASDTASIVLEDCRIPYDNILGSPEIMEKKGGFRGVMATFDATRPGVAAGAVGVARAALEFTKEKFEEEGYTFPYDRGIHSLNAVQKDVLEMEAELDAARLLVWKAAAMLDSKERNSLEASSAKAKAGKAASIICQKCIALLGPLGYSCDWLVEKWARDVKITDLFEGTGQINMLIVARNILQFGRDKLK